MQNMLDTREGERMKGKLTNGYVLVLAAACMWGSVGIFVKAISAMAVSSQSMAALRLLFGALILAPVLFFRGQRVDAIQQTDSSKGALAGFRLSKNTVVPTILLGAVGLALSNFMYYESMRSVGISTASVLLYTSPIFALVLGRILYREGVGTQKLFAVGLNVVGCVLTVTGGDFSSFSFSWYGVMTGVIAGLGGALMAVFSRMTSAENDPLTVTFWAFVAGAVFMGVISFPWIDVRQVLSVRLILLLAAFGTIPTAFAYIVYMTGLACDLETSKVPVVSSAETVVAAAVGIYLYGEAAGAMKLIGICTVLFSIGVMSATFSGRGVSAIVDRVLEALDFNLNLWQRNKHDDLQLLNERLASAGGSSKESDDSWKSWMYVR